ncbi:MAG: carbohydrate kinase family protein [Phycisphaerales bacterium]|nr:MAG: carbohydrate kinase family protein [Phycisphaerales bacterium]
MVDVVCLGQYTADVVVDPVTSMPEKGKAVFVESISLHNGGSACNAAVALGKLGVKTAVIGKVGCDTFGDFLIDIMDEAGLDASAMVRDAGVRTSSTTVLVSPDGERSFFHYFGGNAHLQFDEIDFDLIARARILHVAAAFLIPGLDGQPLADVLAQARALGVTTCLDTAWDAQERWMSVLKPCLPHLDFLLPSMEEAQILTGRDTPLEMARTLNGYGVKTVVIKLGAKGCLLHTTNLTETIPAFSVDRVVDTLGAGDCFVAGFLAGLIHDWDLPRACLLANAAGAACVSARGTSGIQPMQQIIENYFPD